MWWTRGSRSLHITDRHEKTGMRVTAPGPKELMNYKTVTTGPMEKVRTCPWVISQRQKVEMVLRDPDIGGRHLCGRMRWIWCDTHIPGIMTCWTESSIQIGTDIPMILILYALAFTSVRSESGTVICTVTDRNRKEVVFFVTHYFLPVARGNNDVTVTYWDLKQIDKTGVQQEPSVREKFYFVLARNALNVSHLVMSVMQSCSRVPLRVRVRVPEQVPRYGCEYWYLGTGTLKWVWVRVRVPSHVETQVRVPHWVLRYGYNEMGMGTCTGTKPCWSMGTGTTMGTRVWV